MDQKKIIRRMLYFNKRAFDNVFNTIASVQDQTVSFFTHFTEKANWITPEGKKVINQMSDSYRTGRSELKSMADENYRRVSRYFVPVDVNQ